MGRTYLRSLILAAVVVSAAGLLPAAQSARGLFDSKALQQNRFAVLAQPVHRLVVGRIGHRRVILLVQIRHHLAVLVPEEHRLVHVVVLAGLEVLRVCAHLGGALPVGAGRAHRARPSTLPLHHRHRDHDHEHDHGYRASNGNRSPLS